VYLQVAGSAGGVMLEKHDADGLHFRAFQDAPVVPFADGTVLPFGAGRITLNANEWFTLKQAIEVFGQAFDGGPEPEWLRWRDVTDMLRDGLPPS
jgi:hypothetical protein